MLDFIGTVITAALMVIIVNALTIFMEVSRAAKIALASVIGVWIGLAAAVAQAGWLAGSRPVAADLVLAIGFGITSAEGSPLQLFSAPGSEAMQHAPWSFVPTVLVPIWLILHAIIAVELRRAKVR